MNKAGNCEAWRGDTFNRDRSFVDEEPKCTNEIRIYFSTAKNVKIPINIDPHLSVRSLRTKIVQVMKSDRFHSGTANAQLDHGGKLEIFLGGEPMDDARSLSTYALVDGSVVHPRWGSVRSSLEMSDALAWMDPDWYHEANIRNLRMAGGFLDQLCFAPDATTRRMIWPGPLVHPNGITERLTPTSAGTATQCGQHPRHPATARAAQVEPPARPPVAARTTRGWEDSDTAAAAAARRPGGLLVL
jgi:hypothetical protein